MDNLWSLLERALGATCFSVEPFHLFPYLDGPAFSVQRADREGLRSVPSRA